MNEIASIPKWSIASIAKHFEDLCASDTLAMYLEGTARKSNKSPNYFEFRINGPYVNQLLINEYKIWVVVNILLVNIIDDEDHYVLNKNQGVLLAAYTPAIAMYRYGTTEQDDGSLVDCMVLDPDSGEKIKISNFGQLSAAERVMESTIEATYQMYYSPTPPFS